MSKTTSKKSAPARRGIPILILAAVLTAVTVYALAALDRAMAPGPEPATEPAPTEPPLDPNPYGPEDFAYEDGYLTCTAGPAVLGVDVSDHQQDIDWAAVAEAGVEFAFVRIGYRGYTQGEIFSDQRAMANLQGARDAGLLVGAYFYSQAISPEEAKAEAEFCQAFLAEFPLDLPMVYDWEYVSAEARTGNMDPETLEQCARTFCGVIEEAGMEPMLYFNPHLAGTLLPITRLDEYPFWLAMYSDTMDYPHAVEYWQYTSAGTVPGIPVPVDLNLMFLPEEHPSEP